MCQDTNQTVVSNFRSGLEHCSLCGRVLSLVASLVEKFFRTMSASDSESNMSGADITITTVHPSPFRGPITGDEFDGQEISFEPSGEQGHSGVPGFVAFADHSYFKLVRCGSSRIQFASLVYRLSGSETGEETSTTPSSTYIYPEAPVLIGWKGAVLWMLCLHKILLTNRKISEFSACILNLLAQHILR